MVYRTKEASLGIKGSDMLPVSREFRAWVPNSRLTLLADIDNPVARIAFTDLLYLRIYPVPRWKMRESSQFIKASS